MTPPPTLPRPIHFAHTRTFVMTGPDNLNPDHSRPTMPTYSVADMIPAAGALASGMHAFGSRGSKFERSVAGFPDDYSHAERRTCLLAAEDAIKAYDAVRPIEEIVWLLQERLRGQDVFSRIEIDVRDAQEPDEIEQ